MAQLHCKLLFMVFFALLFGFGNRLPELRHCGDSGRVQGILTQVTPDGGCIERVFNSAAINFKAVFGGTDLVAHVRASILRSKTGVADSGRMALLGTNANVPIIRLQDHGTVVGG